MHPYYYQELMNARQDELSRAAARTQVSETSARHQVRQNAGWLLVQIGLKLALGPEARSTAARLV